MKQLICSARKGMYTNHIAHLTVSTTHITSGGEFISTKHAPITCGPSIPKRMREDYEKRQINRFIDKLGMDSNYCDTLPFINGEDIKQGMPIL